MLMRVIGYWHGSETAEFTCRLRKVRALMRALAVGIRFIDFPFVSVITVHQPRSCFFVPVQPHMCKSFDIQCLPVKQWQIEMARDLCLRDFDSDTSGDYCCV